MSIEVHVAGRGRVHDGEKTVSPDQSAQCDLCGKPSQVVVSLSPSVSGGTFGCRDCLRTRLEATTVATYLLQEPASSGGLPWGKISG